MVKIESADVPSLDGTTLEGGASFVILPQGGTTQSPDYYAFDIYLAYPSNVFRLLKAIDRPSPLPIGTYRIDADWDYGLDEDEVQFYFPAGTPSVSVWRD